MSPTDRRSAPPPDLLAYGARIHVHRLAVPQHGQHQPACIGGDRGVVWIDPGADRHDIVVRRAADAHRAISAGNRITGWMDANDAHGMACLAESAPM